MKKLPIFHQNHGPAPLQKKQCLQLSNINVFVVKKAFFLSKYVAKPFLRSIWEKKVTGKKFQISDQSYGLTPFPKMQILQFFNINLMFL